MQGEGQISLAARKMPAGDLRPQLQWSKFGTQLNRPRGKG
jgi:hypothetical protein